MFDSIDGIPETVHHLWMTVGRVYFERLLDYDVYKQIAVYDKDILILHGDKDSLVNVSYSEKAAEVYPSAELIPFSFGMEARPTMHCLVRRRQTKKR